MIAPKSNLKCINLVFFYFPLSSPRVGESGRWSVGMDNNSAAREVANNNYPNSEEEEEG